MPTTDAALFANCPPCPVCLASSTAEVLRITPVPIYCNVLHVSRDAALNAPRGDLALRFCPTCGHLFNAAFDPSLVKYQGDYENSLHFSPRFQAYATKLAASLVARHDLHGKRVTEIACGQGDLLYLLCTLGANRGLGFDPGHVPGRRDLGGGAEISFVQDYWREQPGWEADLVVCRHALEHLPQPGALLAGLRRAIGERSTALYFEVPDARFTLDGLGIWDLIYEHCGYFTPSSLAEVFRRAGFVLDSIESAFGGQFLGLHVRPTAKLFGVEPSGLGVGGTAHAAVNEIPLPLAAAGPPGALEADLPMRVERFAAAYCAKVAAWRLRLDELRRQGRRTVLWGAGSKGVSFINTLQVGEAVAALVDLNPHKQGRFVPGTGHQVLAPAALAERTPDVVIVLNPQYRDEIAADLAALDIQAELLVDEVP